ncbi:MAG: hypothetical protein HP052_00640 [Firmicutes bacterium]|nr:hypothetical protein [Bacillota bacterium]
MDKVALMSELGDYSGLRTLGYTEDEIAALTAAWKRENSSGSSGSGSSNGSEDDDRSPDYDAVLQATKKFYSLNRSADATAMYLMASIDKGKITEEEADDIANELGL